MMKLGIFGLGEAGSLIAADLAAAGADVTGYDPAQVATPKGVSRVSDPAAAVAHAEVVLAITAGADAITAIGQSLEDVPTTALYADFSTHAPGTKKTLAEIAAGRGFEFVDIALLGVVPGNGLRTPALAAGNGADRFVDIFSSFGMPVTRVSGLAGDAAQRKLLRSIMMKGLAGTIIEALRAAEKAGCVDWLWTDISNEITRADEVLLARLVTGSGLHAKRRLEEMQACRQMLLDLGVDPLMTSATVANLRNVLSEGLPGLSQV